MSQHRGGDAERLDAFVQRQVTDAVRRRQSRAEADAALRANALVADLDRDQVATLLNQAFAEGRLTPEEHADRTARALAARTRADLDGVMSGLSVPTAEPAVHPARRLLFWAVAAVCAPMLMTSFGILLAGDGADRFTGLVVLLLLGAGLRKLHRRAWPRPA